jgi:hypothetical protein
MTCLIELDHQWGRRKLEQGEGHFNLGGVLHLVQRSGCGLWSCLPALHAAVEAPGKPNWR